MTVRGVLRVDGEYIGFWCPGCEETHTINAERWAFDGNYDAPTLSPSILITGGHYMDGWKQQHGDRCYCNWNAVKQIAEKDPDLDCVRCHSFVKAGFIQLLADCSHKLAGTTHRLIRPAHWRDS